MPSLDVPKTWKKNQGDYIRNERLWKHNNGFAQQIIIQGSSTNQIKVDPSYKDKEKKLDLLSGCC